MAKSDHTASARPDAAPRSQRKPTNPLGRPYWMFNPTGDTTHHRESTCAVLAEGINTLVRLLANSIAFRELQESTSPNDPTQTPLDPQTIEGILAALYMLSEREAEVCWEIWERVEESWAGEG